MENKNTIILLNFNLTPTSPHPQSHSRIQFLVTGMISLSWLKSRTGQYDIVSIGIQYTRDFTANLSCIILQILLFSCQRGPSRPSRAS